MRSLLALIREWLSAVREVREYDAGACQTVAGCVINPDRYVDVHPIEDAVTADSWFLGRPKRARCEGCFGEVELDRRGRIPPHKPAPPPYRTCAMGCGAPMTPNYNHATCGSCSADADRRDAVYAEED